jgi:hypothetical protein
MAGSGEYGSGFYGSLKGLEFPGHLGGLKFPRKNLIQTFITANSQRMAVVQFPPQNFARQSHGTKMGEETMECS